MRMNDVLAEDYAPVWAETMVLGELGSRTVVQAISDGIDSKRIWLAVWAQLELADTLR